MARDKALGSAQDDDAIFDSGVSEDERLVDTGTDREPVDDSDDGDDDRDALSEAIQQQGRNNRQDDKAISQAIKGARLGNELRAEAQPAQPEAKGQPQKSDSVPLATFLEVEKELRELRRQAQQPRQAQPQPQQQPQQDIADMLYTDPEAYHRTVMQTVESRIARIELNNDLQRAADKHADVWDEAFNGFLERAGEGRDPALYQMVMRSPSPGQAIVNWHKQQKTLSEVGEDPAAYRQRVLDEALDNEEYLARVAERLGIAYDSPRAAPAAAVGRAPNGQFKPASVTRLPTSLSRMSGRAAEADGDDGDGSDEAIFNAGRRGRR